MNDPKESMDEVDKDYKKTVKILKVLLGVMIIAMANVFISYDKQQTEERTNLVNSLDTGNYEYLSLTWESLFFSDETQMYQKVNGTWEEYTGNELLEWDSPAYDKFYIGDQKYQVFYCVKKG